MSKWLSGAVVIAAVSAAGFYGWTRFSTDEAPMDPPGQAAIVAQPSGEIVRLVPGAESDPAGDEEIVVARAEPTVKVPARAEPEDVADGPTTSEPTETPGNGDTEPAQVAALAPADTTNPDQTEQPADAEVKEPAATSVDEPGEATEDAEQAPTNSAAQDGARTAPDFDIVRVDADGQMVVAGQARPGERVEILLDGKVVGEADADAQGGFVAVIFAELSGSAQELQLRVFRPLEIAEAQPAQVEPTPKADAEPESEPVAQATAEAAPEETGIAANAEEPPIPQVPDPREPVVVVEDTETVRAVGAVAPVEKPETDPEVIAGNTSAGADRQLTEMTAPAAAAAPPVPQRDPVRRRRTVATRPQLADAAPSGDAAVQAAPASPATEIANTVTVAPDASAAPKPAMRVLPRADEDPVPIEQPEPTVAMHAPEQDAEAVAGAAVRVEQDSPVARAPAITTPETLAVNEIPGDEPRKAHAPTELATLTPEPEESAAVAAPSSDSPGAAPSVGATSTPARVTPNTLPDAERAAAPKAAERGAVVSAPVIILPSATADGAPALVQPRQDDLALIQPAGDRVEGVVLDRISYGETGEVRFTGRGRVGKIIRIYGNAQALGTTQVAADGTWAWSMARPRAQKMRLFRFDEIDSGGAVTSRIETPFQYSSISSQELRQRRVVVQRGDVLWRIAEQFYGEGIRYSAIYGANAELIRDPDLIYPGQVFSIPELVDVE